MPLALPRLVLSTRTRGQFWPPPTSRNGRISLLTSKLSKHFGVPVYLDNDANMAGLAEWQLARARDIMILSI